MAVLHKYYIAQLAVYSRAAAPTRSAQASRSMQVTRSNARLRNCWAAPNGRAIEAGTPTALFATHVGGAVQGLERQQYAVSRDGQRFLMSTVTEDTSHPIKLIRNWKPKP